MPQLWSVLCVLTLGLLAGSEASSLPLLNATFAVPGIYNFTVPQSVRAITVQAYGAPGSGNGHYGQILGGYGGIVIAMISVTPGEVLGIFVGGTGNFTHGGFNGGGKPGTDLPEGGGGGGGGASDVRQGGFSLSNRVIVAGGGGGYGDAESMNEGDGGAAGFPNGQNGAPGDSAPTTGGGGGTQTVGGDPGLSVNCGNGTLGSLAVGGVGARTDTGWGGGGGGGGFYGGGGGGCVIHDPNGFGGGGGGGSSYAASTATNVTYSVWNQTSIPDGKVIITYTVFLATTTSLISSANPAPPGANVTFTASVSGGSAPTGNVTLADGSTVLLTQPLGHSGVVTFTTSTLSLGVHSISAEYSGDALNFQSSAVLSQDIGSSGSTLVSNCWYSFLLKFDK